MESSLPAPPIDNATPLPITNSTMTKSGKTLSEKQTNLQKMRSETLSDMREKYSERFAGYDKAPKAKAYHAAGLTTIRQKQGDAAYTAALNDIMDKNDPKLGKSMTRKVKKNTSVNTAVNRTAMTTVVSSIEDMGRTAKGLIDTMVQTSKALSKELEKSGNTANLKQLTKKVKSKKSKAPLSTIYEGNNSTRRNNSTPLNLM